MPRPVASRWLLIGAGTLSHALVVPPAVSVQSTIATDPDVTEAERLFSVS